MMAWYTVENIDTEDTPALVVYADRVQKNIDVLKTFVDDINKLRPHIKTSKNPEVIRLMLAAGIVKFKCATIAEAEMLALAGAKDVLLAYQPTRVKALRFAKLQQRYPETTFACLIDNRETLARLSAVAQQSRQPVRVFIDLNVGMNRTGIAPGAEALELYHAAEQTAGITFTGLHAYDGHLHDAGLQVRTRKCDEAFAGVEKLRREIQRASGRDPCIVAGGTPTFPIHAKRPGVEASPGTFIYWDKGYQQILAEQPFLLAALVISRVISLPDKETLCVDLGHKSISSENPLDKRVYFLNAPDLEPVGHSEEHMVFRTKKDHAYRIGDVLYGVPHHICPTVALYDEVLVCRDGRFSERWPVTARKRKINV